MDGPKPATPATPPPPVLAGVAPPLLAPLVGGSTSGRQLLRLLLSVCFGLFLADAIVSLVDDTLILAFGVHLLTAGRGMLFLFTVVVALLVYVLMGFNAMIPKRLFLPITLFSPAAALVSLPLLTYFYHQMQWVAWGISVCQVLLAVGVLFWLQGGIRFRRPLVAERWLAGGGFSWRNLVAFVLANALVLLPGVLVYLAVCASLAVGHFSDGFVKLGARGLTVEARKYARDDGKTIQLVPMAHIGDASFYQELTQSFPSNATILMEGVSDEKNLLTNKITYKRTASSLGLAEQHEEFKPVTVNMVAADVDVSQFTTNTIDLLNLVMLVHANGMTPENLLKLTQYQTPPGYELELLDDLLHKRNLHLLGVIKATLAESDALIVPWGAAHMPEVAREIQKSGFHLAEVKEFTVIRFGARGRRSAGERTAAE
jgi:hypothetical protein